MLNALLTALVWLGGGYFCGDFIIRWNQRHLLGDAVSPKKLAVADRLNADLSLYRGTKVSIWRVILTLIGPITIPKAGLLRLCGGRAQPRNPKRKEKDNECNSLVPRESA